MLNLMVESRIIKNGQIIIDNIPFPDGEEIEIIFWKKNNETNYPLRGEKFTLIEPFGSVSESDWEINN